MNNICFKGFGENIVTFEADSALTVAGVPVKVVANGKVAPAANGEKFCGVAVSVRDGYAGVQLHGYVELPLSGTAAVGYQSVAAGASGKVKVAEDGKEVLVLFANGDTVGFIL
ncbi:MAG: hypothetical protein ACI4GZ_03110 [Ruminococcus sp.]